MKQTLVTMFSCAAVLGALTLPRAVLAQDEDTQFWLISVATGELDDDTNLTIDATYRIREDRRGGDERTLRFLIDQEISDAVKIGGGLGVFEAANGQTQIRITQQATVRLGRFDARTRIEQRFFDAADQMELRFRQRLRYTHPISPKLRASVSLEWLNLVEPRFERTQGRDEFRPHITMTYQAADSLNIGLNYLAIISPRGSLPGRVSHIPQASIAWRF